MSNISCISADDFDKVYRKYVGYQKKNESIVSKFRKVHYDKTADKIEHCSEYSHFKVCWSCNTHHFNGTKVCKSRFCYVCAHKRGLSYLYRYGEVLKDYESKGYKIKFMTLTMKNMDNLSDMMAKFNNDFHRFRSYKIRTTNVLGAVATRETTYNFRDDNWHFHSHSIIILNPGCDITNEELSSFWLKRTGDSYIVDIRDTKRKEVDGVVWHTDFMELFKYSTKLKVLDKMPDNRFKELVDSFFNARLVSGLGVLYGRVNDEDVEKDLDNVDMRDLKTLCCAVCSSDRLYDVELKSKDVKCKVYRLVEKNKKELIKAPNELMIK